MFLYLVFPIIATVAGTTAIVFINRGKGEVIATTFWMTWFAIIIGLFVWLVASTIERTTIADELAYAETFPITFEEDTKDGTTYIVEGDGKRRDISDYENATLHIIDPQSDDVPHVDEYVAYGHIFGTKLTKYDIWLDNTVNLIGNETDTDTSSGANPKGVVDVTAGASGENE